MTTVHVIGAGLSGLACAVRLARGGRGVRVHEAAGHAGGRCRSFFDAAIGRRVDNGNHLLLSGNHAAMAYLDEIGAGDTFAGPGRAEFPFLDLKTGDRWVVRPNAGPLPWWILAPGRRVPGTVARDYLAALRLARAGDDDTVVDCLDPGSALFERFWEPLAVAALNAPANVAAARLLWPVLRETFGKGAGACRPLVARDGLSESLVDPALSFLARHGAAVELSQRLRNLVIEDEQITVLQFRQGDIAVAAGDRVVMAVPPAAVSALLPAIEVPTASQAIVGAHFRLDRAPPLPGGSPFLGLVGGDAHWLFMRGDVASITISAAGHLATAPVEDIAARTWHDVSRALGIPGSPMPVHCVIKEKRATFAQIPAEVKKRPGTVTGIGNLLLAGDWTDTGLPATIEGAVRSGHAAARAAS